MSKILFRPEVLAMKKVKQLGGVSVNIPLRVKVAVCGIAIFLGLFALFAMFATFSEKCLVRGYLNSTKGVARIYPLKNGVLKESRVHQGQHVRKGDPLFMIDTSSLGFNKTKRGLEFTNLAKRKASLEIEIANKKKEIQKLDGLLKKHFIPLSLYQQQADALSHLENNKNNLEIEFLHYRQSQSYWLRAPISGNLSAVIFQKGEYVSSSKILAKILPDHSKLLAEIFVPVHQAGFLRPKGEVVIQYDAYPSAHFGCASAVILDVSQSILTDEEEDKPFLMRGPYYKVRAKLLHQSLSLSDTDIPLLQGMTFKAFIMGEKKTLWQWAFDPIYNRYAKLKS